MNNQNNILKTIADIKSLKIQGATNVAKESIKAIGLWSSYENWKYKELENKGLLLAKARPTEPLARNAMYWLLEKAKNKEGRSLTSEANEIVESLTYAKEKIVQQGLLLIKNKQIILTHCHSSTVTGILIAAFRKGIKFKVYLTETRPRFQGHLTAKELVRVGIDATMIADSEASFILSKEDDIKIDMVLLGADAIEKDGSALNKVGSYGISLSAKNAKIPLFVTATLLKYSPFQIEIEERKGEEIWKNKPKDLKIFNPAFDKIPHNFITAFITEYGLIKPNDIYNSAKKYAPWIFKSHNIK